MIGPILQGLGKILFQNRKILIKAGQEAAKYYGKHHQVINRGIKIAVIALVQYNSYRAQQYEKKLQEQLKNYRESTNKKYKTAARGILNEIDIMIEKENLTEDEKKELRDILTRHAAWC